MGVALIAAIAQNRVIGDGSRIPWRLRDDLKRFKELTLGHEMIMGRKTLESLPGILPDRKHIVVTRKDYSRDGIVVAHSLYEALSMAEDPFIIGGAQIYEQAMPLVDRMYLTIVKAQPHGDVFFPQYDPSEWRLAHQSALHRADERNSHDFIFMDYERKTTVLR